MQAEGNIDGRFRRRERIIVFAPTAGELERLERCDALTALARSFELTCVVPPDLPATRAVAAAHFGCVEIIALDLAGERLGTWLEAFRRARPRPSVGLTALRRLALRGSRAAFAASTPTGKVLRRGLLRLAQAPVLSVRVRRLLLAAATLEPSEDLLIPQPGFGCYAGGHGRMQAAPPPIDAIVEILRRTRPLFALLPTAMRDRWYPEMLWACESQGTPCVVLEHGWGAMGNVWGTPPLVWCRRSGLVGTSCASLLPQVLTRCNGPRDDASIPREDGERLTSLCVEIAAPYARRVRRARAARERAHISQAYGAGHVARAYARVADGEAHIPGYWMHGWLPAHHNVDPALIALHKRPGQGPSHDYETQIRKEKREVAQWVARDDQATFLARRGYRKARAIGLPIVYLPPVRVVRVPGSLLVMPPHARMSHGPGDPVAERYAAAIADVRGSFAHVAVCLSQEDLEAQQWADAFRRRGFEVFSAVDPYRADALHQLKRLLCSFEFVTTNGFGSHIAYAAYCGARVSVFGPFAEVPIERMARTHAVRMFPELLARAYELCTEAPLRRQYPFLFVDPEKAAVRAEWGGHEAGEGCKVAPDELAQLFGWGAQRQAVATGLAMGQR